MEKVGNWANKIVTHFWFCCEKCNENVEDLKVKLTFIIYCFTNLCVHICRRNGLGCFITFLVNTSRKLGSVTMNSLMSKKKTYLILISMVKILKQYRR